MSSHSVSPSTSRSQSLSETSDRSSIDNFDLPTENATYQRKNNQNGDKIAANLKAFIRIGAKIAILILTVPPIFAIGIAFLPLAITVVELHKLRENFAKKELSPNFLENILVAPTFLALHALGFI